MHKNAMEQLNVNEHNASMKLSMKANACITNLVNKKLNINLNPNIID